MEQRFHRRSKDRPRPPIRAEGSQSAVHLFDPKHTGAYISELDTRRVSIPALLGIPFKCVDNAVPEAL